MLGDILSGIGYALDTPGALTRGLLAGRPGERVSASDLFGLDENNWGGNLLASIVTDPLTYLGAGGALKGLGALAKGRKAGAIAEAASLAPKVAEEAPVLAKAIAPEVAPAIAPIPEVAAVAPKLQQGPFYSRLEEAIRNGPESMKSQSMLNALKKAGVSDEELQWTRMGELANQGDRVTKDQMLKHFGENQVRVNEVVKGGKQEAIWLPSEGGGVALQDSAFRIEPSDNGFTILRRASPYASERYGTFSNIHQAQHEAERIAGGQYGPNAVKWSKYQTPGGQNYKEMLLTLPDANTTVIGKDASGNAIRLTTDKRFQSGHWDEPNVMAHVRFNERVGPKGEKILHVEEIQSDWHQGAAKSRQQMIDNKALEIAQTKGGLDFKPTQADSQEAKRIWQESQSEATKLIQKDVGYRPKNAAELEKQLNELQNQYDIFKNKWAESVEDANNTRIQRQAIKSKMHDIQAQLDAPPEAPFKKNWHELAMKRMLQWASEHGFDKVTWNTGEQVAKQVGGKLSGQQKFYDEILPNFLSKYGKQFGASPEGHSLPITPELRQSILSRGQPLMALGGGGALLAALMGSQNES